MTIDAPLDARAPSAPVSGLLTSPILPTLFAELRGVIDEAVSAKGEPYANLPNAHKFERTFDASCSCRTPGQSWAEALAHFDSTLGEFVLPYEAMRQSADPDSALLQFLQSTYDAAANCAHWDRAALEASPKPGNR